MRVVFFSFLYRCTGKSAGKEVVMAFWSPPASADPDLKQQLFDFKVCENLPERTLFSVTLNFLMKIII